MIIRHAIKSYCHKIHFIVILNRISKSVLLYEMISNRITNIV